MFLLKVINIILNLSTWDASYQSLRPWRKMSVRSGLFTPLACGKVSEEVCHKLGHRNMASGSFELCCSDQLLWNM